MAKTTRSAKSTKQAAKKGDRGKTFKGFTDEERAAMKEHVQELKAERRRGSRADKADGESAVLANIAAMPEPDRALGERLQAIIKASGPVGRSRRPCRPWHTRASRTRVSARGLAR